MRIRIISKLNGIYLAPLCLSIRICFRVFFYLNKITYTIFGLNDMQSICWLCKQVCLVSNSNAFSVVASLDFILNQFYFCSFFYCIRLLWKRNNNEIFFLFHLFNNKKESNRCIIDVCQMISDDYNLLLALDARHFRNYIYGIYKKKCNNIECYLTLQLSYQSTDSPVVITNWRANVYITVKSIYLMHFKIKRKKNARKKQRKREKKANNAF